MNFRRGYHRRTVERAFTLVELLSVIVLMAIAAQLALPLMGNRDQYRLREAVKLVAADVQFAQADSIAHPDQPRAIVFDTALRKYWIAPWVSTALAPAESNAIKDPVRRDPANPALFAPFSVTFPTAAAPGPPNGRAAALANVSIASMQNLISQAGFYFLPFDGYGTPLDITGQPSANIARISLAAGSATLRVEVAPSTGEVTIP